MGDDVHRRFQAHRSLVARRVRPDGGGPRPGPHAVMRAARGAAGRGGRTLGAYTGLLLLALLPGLAMLGPGGVFGTSRPGWLALAVPVGLAVGVAARWADRTVLRAAVRRAVTRTTPARRTVTPATRAGRPVTPASPAGQTSTHATPAGPAVTHATPAGQTVTHATPPGQTVTHATPAGQTVTHATPAGPAVTHAIPAGRAVTHATPAGPAVTHAIPAERGATRATPAGQAGTGATPARLAVHPADRHGGQRDGRNPPECVGDHGGVDRQRPGSGRCDGGNPWDGSSRRDRAGRCGGRDAGGYLAKSREVSLGAVLSVAVAEEALYRGALLRAALLPAGWLGPALVVVTVAAFALSHLTFGWPHVLAKAPLGAGATIATLALGSAAPAIVAHAWFNFSAWRDVRPGRTAGSAGLAGTTAGGPATGPGGPPAGRSPGGTAAPSW